MSENKYKMFRNYMTNELGITRDDIEQWTRDAVRETAEKYLNGVDIEDLANQALNRAARNAVGAPFGGAAKHLTEQVAKDLASQIQLTFKGSTNDN